MCIRDSIAAVSARIGAVADSAAVPNKRTIVAKSMNEAMLAVAPAAIIAIAAASTTAPAPTINTPDPAAKAPDVYKRQVPSC